MKLEQVPSPVYVLSVKENQGHLFGDISVLFGVDREQNFKYASLNYKKIVNKGHGRIEVRECWSTSNPRYLNLIRGVQNWAGIRSIAMIVCTRIIDDKQTQYVRYYISSFVSDAGVPCKSYAGSGSKHMIMGKCQVVLNNEPTRHKMVHILDFRKG
jgi:hypothetical protein